jgi:hypothetical protein
MLAKRIASGLLLGGCLLAAASAVRADVNYGDYELALYVGDARPFDKWEGDAFDRAPYANEGFFFSWDYVKFLMKSVEPSTVGADGITRAGMYGTLGSMIEYNSITTGWFSDEIFDGQDTTVGYIEKNQGWFFRWFELHGRNVDLVRSDAGVIFEDPQSLLVGFYDLDGDGLDDSFDGDLNFGRDGGNIDADDLVQQGVVFKEIHVNQNTKLYTIELNHLLRLPRELCGAYWETFCGVRFIDFKESFNVFGIGGVLADSFWNTEAENKIVGPQVGVRWFRTDGRFTFSGDARAVAAANFQTIRQVVSFGNKLSQNEGRGTDNSERGDDTFRSRWDQFVPRESVSSYHEMELGPLVEASAQAQIHLTRKLTFRLGVKGMYMDALARPAAMINYSFPDMGVNMNNNNQRMWMVGINAGFDLNR